MPPIPPIPPVQSLPSGSALGAAAPGSPTGGARVLDFRRRGGPLRRRRRHPLLLLVRPLGAALVVVLLPLGLAAWVLTSRRFQLQEIVVDGGAQRVKPDWVRRALAPYQGENLVRLPLTEAASRLQQNPWVQTVELQKELPDRLRVELTEKRPVALLRSGGRLVYADEDGRPIVPVDSLPEARRAGMLEVTFSRPVQGGMEAALEVAGELGRVRADWASALSRIEVLGEEDFRLHTDALPFPLLVTHGQVGPKVRRLEELLPELQRRYPVIESVDLRFSRRIVVQPGVPVPTAAAAGAGAQI
jgi:cell division protein FtsQ